MNTPLEINKTEKFMTLTQCDNDSYAHLYKIDGVIYRGVFNQRSKFIEELFSKGIIDTLINDELLTPSKLVQKTFKDFSILIEQNELLSPTLSNELSPSIRRDAALVLLRIEEILDGYGATLNSFDLTNIALNSRGRPVLHNLDAIIPKGSRKFLYAEFYSNFLGPLRLVHKRPELVSLVQRAGRVTIDEDVSIRWPFFKGVIRWISSFGSIGGKVSNFYQRLMVSPFTALLNLGRYKTFVLAALSEKAIHKNSSQSDSSNWTAIVIKDLSKHLNHFKFEGISQRWTQYHAHLDLANIVNAGEDWEEYFTGPREKALLSILDSVGSGTLLDIGANNGYFSMLGAHKGFLTTAVDYDIGAIDSLYRLLVNSNSILTIRPLIFDFVNPDFTSSQRYRSDVVFALGFIHHMRLVELLPWSVIVDRLSEFTEKVLVTEFKNDTAASNSKSELTEQVEQDYCLDNLVIALKNNFNTVEVIGGHSMTGFSSVRTMIVCRR